MKMKCRVIKATKRDIVRLALGSASAKEPRVWKCVPHRVHFGTDAGESKPEQCPIPRSFK